MTDEVYTPTDDFGVSEQDGEEVRYCLWQASRNLSPLPDAKPPSFPRRLDWEGRADGGWLALGPVQSYGACGCCGTRPCVPQCPLQSIPPRTPEFWQGRWRRTAADMLERGEEVNPLYAPQEGTA